MIDQAMDRGGLKDSKNAPNSFSPKINRTVFWRLGTDMELAKVENKNRIALLDSTVVARQ